MYESNTPLDEYSHNAGSPLDARDRAVNTCDDDNENTKSRLDTSADNNAPGAKLVELDEGATCVEDVDLATVVVVTNRRRSM